jgi:hypothetical protein
MPPEKYDPAKHGELLPAPTPPAATPGAPEPYDPAKHGPLVAAEDPALAQARAEAQPDVNGVSDAWQSPVPKAVGDVFKKDMRDTLRAPVNAVGRIAHDVVNPQDFVKDKVNEVLAPGRAVASGTKFALEHPKEVPGKVADFINDQFTRHPFQTLLNAATLGPKGGPLGLPIREIAGPAAAKAVDVLGGASDFATGAGEGAAAEAFRTGRMGDKIASDFRTALRDPAAGMTTALQNAKQGIQTMKSAMLDKYAELKNIWSKDGTQLSFDPINKAEKDLMNEIQVQGTDKFKVSDTDRAQIQGMQDVIDQWRKDSSLHNIQGFDDLKQRLRNEVNYKTASSPVIRAATQLSAAAKDAILSQVPDSAVYKKAMEGYFKSSDHLNDIEKALALGKNKEAGTSISRLQSVMRNNVYSLYGSRTAALDALEKEGNVSLMPSLAGAAMSSWFPRGVQRGVIGGSLPELAMHLFGHGFSPEALAATAAGMAATSPRLAGEAFHGAGALSGAVGPAAAQSTLGVPGAALRYESQPQRKRGGYFGGI